MYAPSISGRLGMQVKFVAAQVRSLNFATLSTAGP
jgi:hypothetical protein